ncbi:putative Polycomb group protein ASXL3 [Planoprotostelium fungivorum]|uniref:Putative Polycomb group protein ASXL3 n=1 Tax=Planoprotostelium fungivorum TaxID=1890364 RepID=A0A2P6N837_9EUKA|nr:putative Polycomb group protein ASXL3 [Planoprotostelium fungivorum]
MSETIVEDNPPNGNESNDKNQSERIAQVGLQIMNILNNIKSDTELIGLIRWLDDGLTDKYNLTLFSYADEEIISALRTASQARARSEPPVQLERPSGNKRGGRMNNHMERALFQSSESPLSFDIINIQTFKNLTSAEKDSLLVHLPPIDKSSSEAVDKLFSSPAFTSQMSDWQDHLTSGALENVNEYQRIYNGLKPILDPWKEKYFEEYWGEKGGKSRGESLEATEAKDSFSYRQSQPEDERTKSTQKDKAAYKDLASMISKSARESRRGDDEDDGDFDMVVNVKPSSGRRKRKKDYSSPDDDDDDIPIETTPKKKPGRKPSSGNAAEGLGFKDSAFEVLKREGKPMSSKEIVDIAIKEGLLITNGKTPSHTLTAILYGEIKKGLDTCPFVKLGNQRFALKEWGGSKKSKKGKASSHSDHDDSD